MKKLLLVLIFLLAASVVVGFQFFQLKTDCFVEPVFSPGSEAQLKAFLYSAKERVDVELYQFSNQELKQVLSDLVESGVKVRVILEPRVESNEETARFLRNSGVEVKWASQSFTNTHSKTAVVDGNKVLVGSINWSVRALNSNRESAVIIECSSVAGEFEEVFEADWFVAS
ncbi:hypothetical protein HUU53_03995 [Candidatus Micrarchaeota archaeon]|nr:hypothetical protein [Candidatus Micrarchaeota archaeon]